MNRVFFQNLFYLRVVNLENDDNDIDNSLYMYREDEEGAAGVGKKKGKMKENKAKTDNVKTEKVKKEEAYISPKESIKEETRAVEAKKQEQKVMPKVTKHAEIKRQEPKEIKPVENKVEVTGPETVKPVKENVDSEPQTSFDNFDEEYNLESKGSGKLVLGITILVIIGLVIFIMNIDNIFSKDDIAAKVNGEKITMERFNSIYNSAVQQYAGITKEDVINQLIEESLLIQEAEREGIHIDEKEIDDFVNQLLESVQSSMTASEFNKKLEEEGQTLEELKEQLRDNYRKQLMINKLLTKKILEEIEVSDEEARDYYDNNLNLFAVGEQVRASHILVKTLEEANEIKAKLDAGAQFAELAREKSIDSSGASGGDLGYFSRGQMVAAFEEAAFSLSINEISEPVETEFGYHIIKVVDKKPGVKREFDEVKEQIKLTLATQNNSNEVRNILTNLVGDLKAEADIKIMLEEIETPTGFAVKDTEEPLAGLESENEAEGDNTADTAVEEPAGEGAAEEEGVEETEEPEELVTLVPVEEEPEAGITTFEESDKELLTKDGKPVIRLFTTTWCPHCAWIKDTFDNVVKEYADKGEIIAYHWELDTGDNTLTEEIETGVPKEEVAIFREFSTGGVPTFVFGGRYSRIGNGYEKENDLAKEEAELRAVIDKLIEEAELKAVIGNAVS